jgi:type II secretory pathway pseudopilin PulG
MTDKLDIPEEKPSGQSAALTPRTVIALLAILTTVLGAILVPNFVRAVEQDNLTACKSNLQNIGAAMEMYTVDWSGKYPVRIELLTPNYLKTIPECPSAEQITYTVKTGKNIAYNDAGFEDYYFMQCEGDNHSWVSVPAGYPQYDSLSGFSER